jgi:hypothetical protein
MPQSLTIALFDGKVQSAAEIRWKSDADGKTPSHVLSKSTSHSPRTSDILESEV